jgi:hypothetical protein
LDPILEEVWIGLAVLIHGLGRPNWRNIPKLARSFRISHAESEFD